MKRRIGKDLLFAAVLWLIWISRMTVVAETVETDYERDYLTRLYTSEDGLAGTAANSIYSTDDGFLWIGGYTGLVRYDGSEFQSMMMENQQSVPINDMAQDADGTLWLGTNGDGVYTFDGTEYRKVELPGNTDETGIINKIYRASDDTIWIGTKAGVFSAEKGKTGKMTEKCEALSGLVIHDIGETAGGAVVVIEKTGRVFVIRENTAEELSLPHTEKGGIPRCCSRGEDEGFYIGTTGSEIWKVSEDGEAESIIDGNGLESFNCIRAFQKGEYWLCSDTGIGVMRRDTATKMNFPLDDSVEEVTQDYQGNFWFASSRQGVLQLYDSSFSDLGAYWGMKETVNSIQVYQGKTYVGCDSGLRCYEGKEPREDALTEACKGERIRQLYQDLEGNLWVSTYQDGVKVMDGSGKIVCFTAENSGLTTNQIRCVWQKKDRNILIGTEEGLFLMDRKEGIQKLVEEDDVLNSKRIMDVKEDDEGMIYAATDGYGVFEIRDRTAAARYQQQEGMASGVILKVVPSEQKKGIWAVTGKGICFLDREGKVQQVTGIPAANCLDLILTDDGDAVILAGNGYFRLKEADLLKTTEISCTWFRQQDGLPIDFTANARNCLDGDLLYMSGTTGAAAIHLEKEETEHPIRLYLNRVTADGTELSTGKNGEIHLASDTHRVNLDVRAINFVHQKIESRYYLDGADRSETTVEDDDTEISYTNLKGGSYTYHYKIFQKESQKCLAEITISVTKDYKLMEQPQVKLLLGAILAAVLVLLYFLIIWIREKRIKRMYHKKFEQEKEEEIARLAYRDLVTGVYNRNCFEEERTRIDMKEVYAVFSVSVNHYEYLKNKYGLLKVEEVLRKAAQLLQEINRDDGKIYRVSENIFYFWVTEPVQLETYIYDLKARFRKLGGDDEVPLSLSVGAIYNNKVEKEKLEELLERCRKMRMLDEKHAEAEFVKGKVKLL